MKLHDTNRHSLEISLAYIHGRLEAQIEIFAASLGVPARELAERMGTLLSPSESGPVLGSLDRVPDLRRAAAQDDSVSRAMALVDSSHPQTPRPDVKPKRKSPWAGTTAAERSAEMKRRMKKAKRKKAATAAAVARRKNSKKNKNRDRAKQKIYQARHTARKLGIEPPPLPRAVAS